nr:rhamnogalacturonan acetylesterase [Prevotella sp.]
MKQLLKYLVLLICVLTLTSSSKHTTIFVIGDSTAAEKSNADTNPERGWAMVLQGFFTENVSIDNHAVNGRSSKSFIDEGRWQKVLDKIVPGDYVIIQFGHNDEKPKADRHTDPGSTFDDNLRRFVRETRAKGGIPILMNAVVRRNFYSKPDGNDDDEKLRNTVNDGDEIVNSDTLIDTHGAYIVSPRVVAQQENCIFIDANKITHDIEQSMGVKGSRKLHMWFTPGEIASIPKGRKDNTHYNVYGARIMAGAFADALAAKVPALKKSIRHYDFVVSSEGRGNYMNLQAAVDAAPANEKTTILVLNGSWNKPVITNNKKIKFVKYSCVKIK